MTTTLVTDGGADDDPEHMTRFEVECLDRLLIIYDENGGNKVLTYVFVRLLFTAIVRLMTVSLCSVLLSIIITYLYKYIHNHPLQITTPIYPKIKAKEVKEEKKGDAAAAKGGDDEDE